MPIARWIAFSISIIFTGLTVPEKGPRIKKDLSPESCMKIDEKLF